MAAGGYVYAADRASLLECMADSCKPAVESIIQRILHRFCLRDHEKEINIPILLEQPELEFYTEAAAKMNLLLEARKDLFGDYEIAVSKPSEESLIVTQLTLKPSSIEAIELLKRKMATSKGNEKLERHRSNPGHRQGESCSGRKAGRLQARGPHVPPVSEPNLRVSPRFLQLPVWRKHGEILNLIDNNQVVIIAGSNSTGISTQIPFMILDHCGRSDAPCRAVCVQPWSLSAVAVAETVAAQRGEKVGSIVSLQTRSESRISPFGLLTVSTTGVFLHSMANSDRLLSSITHLIIDHVHERDRYTDTLLAFLRIHQRKLSTLKLIILMADVNTHNVAKYLHNCPLLKIASETHQVTHYFLEDILQQTSFLETFKKERPDISPDEAGGPSRQRSGDFAAESEFAAFFDQLLEAAARKHDRQALTKLVQLAQTGEMPINYRHSQTGVTLLAAAAFCGDVDAASQAIHLGADPTLQSKGYTPADIARTTGHDAVGDFLDGVLASFKADVCGEEQIENIPREWRIMTALAEQPKPNPCVDANLTEYFKLFSEDIVNLDLIHQLILHIDQYFGPGTILVFLPGYDEVTSLSGLLKSPSPTAARFDVRKAHALMKVPELSALSGAPKSSTRKVILATSFVESGLYMEDVVYVIDSGRTRERSDDSVVSTHLDCPSWISKSSAALRAEKAGVGKSGVAFHVYSRHQHYVMIELPVPEINRGPVQDVLLCMANLMASTKVSISLLRSAVQFMDPPSQPAVQSAIGILRSLDAIDAENRVSEIGRRLYDLPVEPRLAKILLMSIVFKCVDPVLTIVACMACGCPFRIPNQSERRGRAFSCKTDLAQSTCSDLIALLRAYQLWETGLEEGREHQVCNEFCLSLATMRSISAIRSQLKSELRGSGLISARGNDMTNLNVHSNCWTAVKAALTVGLYPNVGRYLPTEKMVITQDRTSAMFHLSSILWNEYSWKQRGSNSGPPDSTNPIRSTLYSCPWVLFERRQKNGPYSFVNTSTIINPLIAILFGGSSDTPLIMEAFSCEETSTACTSAPSPSNPFAPDLQRTATKAQHVILKLSDIVQFKVLQSSIRRQLQDPSRALNDEPLLRTALSVLIEEDREAGFVQPQTLGRRPRFVNAEAVNRNQSRAESQTRLERNYVKNVPSA